MKCDKCKTELFKCDFVDNDKEKREDYYRCPNCFKVKKVNC